LTSEGRQGDLEYGRKVRAKVLGLDNVSTGRNSDSTIPDLGELSDEVLWGRIWGRPGVDIKLRSIATVVALLTLERYDYARIHIGGAKNLGVSRIEMSEIIFQLTFYVGLPVVHEGLKIVSEIYGVNNEN